MPRFGSQPTLVAGFLIAAVQHHGDISVAVFVPGQIAGNESLYGVRRVGQGR